MRISEFLWIGFAALDRDEISAAGQSLSPTTAAKSQPGTAAADECRPTPTAEGAQQNNRTK